MSHMGGSEAQQFGMSISPGSSHATVGDMEHWMGGGFDTLLLPSFASHYVTGDGGMSGRRSTLRYSPSSYFKPVHFSDPVRPEVSALGFVVEKLKLFEARSRSLITYISNSGNEVR